MAALTSRQQKMVAAHLRIAVMASERLWPRFRVWITKDEALSSAYVGLCKAALKWREGRGAQFSTFAWKACLQQVRDDAKDLGPIIHIPRIHFSTNSELTNSRGKEHKYKKAAENAAHNRADARRAMRVDYWPLYDFDELPLKDTPHTA